MTARGHTGTASRLASMSARRRFAALMAAVAMAVVVGGCGSSSSLPRDIPAASAPDLIADLNAVLGACGSDPAAAADAANRYADAVAQLPDTIDPGVLDVLRQTSANLKAVAGTSAGCASGATGTSGFQGFQPPAGTDSTTAAPVTTPSTTTPTETTASTTPTETHAPSASSPGASGEPGSNGQGPAGTGPPGHGGGTGTGSGGGVSPEKAKGR